MSKDRRRSPTKNRRSKKNSSGTSTPKGYLDSNTEGYFDGNMDALSQMTRPNNGYNEGSAIDQAWEKLQNHSAFSNMRSWKAALNQQRGKKGPGQPSDYMVHAMKGILKADLYGQLKAEEVTDLIHRAAGYMEIGGALNVRNMGVRPEKFGAEDLVDHAWRKLQYYPGDVERMKTQYNDTLRNTADHEDVPEYMKQTLITILNRRVPDNKMPTPVEQESLGDLLSEKDIRHLLHRIVGKEGKRLRWWEGINMETGEQFKETDKLNRPEW